jgi:predicted nucleic acid-binding protein
MAENEYRRPYLDTSVYIAVLKAESGRVDIARNILEDARKGVLSIVASTFVAAEVIRVKGAGEAISEDDESIIDAWVFHEFVTWVELDLTLALEARKLARDHGLKPADAVHLASAIRGGADILMRWNGRFRVEDGELGGMRVCEPHWFGQQQLPG